MRTLFVITLLFFTMNIKADIAPEDVVRSFGDAMSSWCSTNNILYREKIDALCSGPKSCRVEDKIHADYQKKRGLTNYETFVLDSYMNMFQTLRAQNIQFQMSNVKLGATDMMPDGELSFVTADIKVSGPVNYMVTDLFLVREGKITGIYSYSSQLGFSHLNGSLINALRIGRYRWVASIRNGYAEVSNEVGNHGLIDIKGNVIIPCIWDYCVFGGGDFARGTNYKDNSDHITYDLRLGGKRTPFHCVQDFIVGREKVVTTFSDNLAVVFNDEKKYGYLNKYDKTYTVQYIYDDATRFCDGYAFVEYAGVGMIIDKSFSPILKDTKAYIICDRLYNGLAKVKDRITGKYGFINKKGKLVIPCIYNQADYFSEGLCCVALGNDKLNYKWGCINTQGDIVIPIIYDGFGGCFENGYIEAIKDGHSHGTLLGLDGKPLPGFDWEYDEIRYISEGFARFKKDGKYGFLNTKGDIAIPAIYDFASFFVDGIACVSIGDKYGKYKYGGINTDGILVIPCIYDNIFYFENGIALVEKDNQVGLIDKYGNSTFFLKKDSKDK